ncbi:class I SAM-dependent methyltransferase [Mycobacterium sp. Lab-001]|uniref:class I SAM-dependent methyltransferase n=1 Tax=Mycobacterium sp. Lab-001 TaxID=3410136 RepID=UPI003D181820
MDISPAAPANHHADHPGFAGPKGFFAALTMLVAGRARARFVVDLASLSSSDQVVDIGCGPGDSVREAARRGASVVGVDPARLMLGMARRVTRDRPGISWLQGSAENLPLPDRSATVVWSVATVHHWADVGAGLAEVRRVLSPGGRFFAIERRVRPGATGLASHGWTDQQAGSFAACCRTAGFDDVHTEKLNRGRRAVQVVKAIRR